uniref:Chitin-binding type-2 domain-containing protein n=1 Tax=Panagrolaimus superbus TaxID=310955 RepID=A0A914YMF1_9BILA
MPLSCPSGTFYSAFTEMCDYKANVVECGGIAPTKQPIAQNPVMIPQSPYGRRPEQPALQATVTPQISYGQNPQPAQQAPAKSTNPCASLTNDL